MFFDKESTSPSSPPPLATPSNEHPLLESPHIDTMSTRQLVTSQALANAAFLHPSAAPTLITAKDPETSASRILIVATALGPAPKILFEQPGTTEADFFAILAATEAAVHQRVVALPSPQIETLRDQVDAARLQRENAALLQELERARSPIKLELPRRKSAVLAESPVLHTPPQSAISSGLRTASPPLDRPSGLPKSKRFMASAPAPAPAPPATANTTTLTPPNSFDAFELGSPRTIPIGLATSGPPRRAMAWGEGMGKEAEDVAAWIREVTGALTPPLTPPVVGAAKLPRSRTFERR